MFCTLLSQKCTDGNILGICESLRLTVCVCLFSVSVRDICEGTGWSRTPPLHLTAVTIKPLLKLQRIKYFALRKDDKQVFCFTVNKCFGLSFLVVKRETLSEGLFCDSTLEGSVPPKSQNSIFISSTLNYSHKK